MVPAREVDLWLCLLGLIRNIDMYFFIYIVYLVWFVVHSYDITSAKQKKKYNKIKQHNTKILVFINCSKSTGSNILWQSFLNAICSLILLLLLWLWLLTFLSCVSVYIHLLLLFINSFSCYIQIIQTNNITKNKCRQRERRVYEFNNKSTFALPRNTFSFFKHLVA